MKLRICLCTASEVTQAYFAAILDGCATLLCRGERGELPLCDLLVTDLDTVSMPSRIPSECRHLTIGSRGTPDILRPITDRELLDRLLLNESGDAEPTLLSNPPRLRLWDYELPLTATEHSLLDCLISRESVPYADLRQAVWGDGEASDNLLRVTVSHLRRKLRPYRIRIESAQGMYTLLRSGEF